MRQNSAFAERVTVKTNIALTILYDHHLASTGVWLSRSDMRDAERD
ncbi:MAG: hypothetical protein H7Z74_03135 [Anaerolineae bacterium]|nr:hypothetical protein [Gemmatimonadaceae bacterium]